MEDMNMFGCITLLGANGELFLERSYELKEGEHTIGNSGNCNIRLKTKSPWLMDIHGIIRVSKSGVAVLINKSTGDPIRINDKLALKPQLLRHEDTLQIVEKKFRYINKYLKDKHEEFFTQEKVRLFQNRKSFNPLTTTPAKTPKYKKKAKTLPQNHLNQSLRGTSTKPATTPNLNRTVNSITTRKNLISKTPNFYRTLNCSGKTLKKFTKKTSNNANKSSNEEQNINDLPKKQVLPKLIQDEDLIVFSPGRQSLSTVNPFESPCLENKFSPADKNFSLRAKKSSLSKMDAKTDDESEDIYLQLSCDNEDDNIIPHTQANDSVFLEDNNTNQEIKMKARKDTDSIDRFNDIYYDSSIKRLTKSLGKKSENHIMSLSSEEFNPSIDQKRSSSTISVKKVNTFDESTQDAHPVDEANVSRSTKKNSSKRVSTFDESTQDAHPIDEANVSRSSKKNSSKRVSTFDESTQDAHSVDEANISRRTQKNSSKRVSTFDESTQDAHPVDETNVSRSTKKNSSKRVSTFDESTQDAHSVDEANISRSTQKNSSKRVSTFDESTQDAHPVDETNVSRSTKKNSLKRVSTFDESTQDAYPVDETNVSRSTKKNSSKRVSTFDESTQDAHSVDEANISRSTQKNSSKRVSTFDESTQDAHPVDETNVSRSKKKFFSKRDSTFDESTQDAVNISSFKSLKRTFDESTKDVDKFYDKNSTQENGLLEKPTKEILCGVSSRQTINVLDATQVLSPVRPIASRKSLRNSHASLIEIPYKSTTQRSLRSQSVKGQLSNSSLTDTSLNQSTASVISISSQSFSSFKRNKSNTSKAGNKLEDTEFIDVVNVTDDGEPIQSEHVINEGNVSERKSRASLEKTRFSNRTLLTTQMFEDVSCTSTPLHKRYISININKEEKSQSMSSTNTARLSEVTNKRRSSSRSSVPRLGEHDCVSCRYSTNRSKSLNISGKPLNRSKSLTEANTPQFATSVLNINSRVEESSGDDETQLRRSRRFSKQTYNPEVEDITPVTPERLVVSGYSEQVFKTPVNKPELFESLRKSAMKSRKRHSTGSIISITKDAKMEKLDLTPKNHMPQKEKRHGKSPLKRLSSFKGVQKLINPPKSPKNDLRNIPSLRNIMSPKLQTNPQNDLTNPVGVKGLSRTPKQQNYPDNELTHVSGVAQLFNISGADVSHQESDIENSEDLFTQLTGQQPRRSYEKAKSLSLNKTESKTRKTMGDLPVCSPRVQQWVEDHAFQVEKLEELSKETNNSTRKSRSRLSPKKAKSQNFELDSSDPTPKAETRENQQIDYIDESTDIEEFVQGETLSFCETDEDFNMTDKSTRKSKTVRRMSPKKQVDNDESTDEEVIVQNEILNLEDTDEDISMSQIRSQKSVEDETESEYENTTDDTLDGKSIENQKIEGGDESTDVEELQDANEDIFANMGDKLIRKSKGCRSLSPKPTTLKSIRSRKTLFNQPDDTPDVNAWKKEQNDELFSKMVDKPLVYRSALSLSPKNAFSKTIIRTRKTVFNQPDGTPDVSAWKNELNEKIFSNMNDKPTLRKSKSARSLSPRKPTPKPLKNRKSELHSSYNSIPNVEAWKKEIKLIKKRKSDSIDEAEIMPRKIRRRVAFLILNEVSSPKTDEKPIRKSTRKAKANKEILEEPVKVAQKRGRRTKKVEEPSENNEYLKEEVKKGSKPRGRRGKIVQTTDKDVEAGKTTTKEESDNTDDKENNEKSTTAKGRKGNTATKSNEKPDVDLGSKARSAKVQSKEKSDNLIDENNDDIEFNYLENVKTKSPPKKRVRKAEPKIEEVVTVSPPKTRRRNVRKNAVKTPQIQFEESLKINNEEIKQSTPRLRSRNAKNSVSETIDLKTVSNLTPIKTTRSTRAAKTQPVKSDEIIASPAIRVKRVTRKAEAETLTVEENIEKTKKNSVAKTRSRKAKNVQNELVAVMEVSTSSRSTRSTRAVELETNKNEETVASPPKRKARKAKAEILEEPLQNNEAFKETEKIVSKSRSRRGKNVQREQIEEIKISTPSKSIRSRKVLQDNKKQSEEFEENKKINTRSLRNKSKK